MKRLLFFTILISSLFIIQNLLQSIYTLWQKQYLVVKAQKELDKKKEESRTLKKRLKETESQEFIEREARSKLFMVREKETEVILPKNLLEASKSASKKEDTSPNWQKWLRLFF